MNFYRFISSAILLSCSLFSAVVVSSNGFAEEMDTQANVQISGSDTSSIVDPENPDEQIDSGEGPSTQGSLRFDFAPTLNFGSASISQKEGISADAELVQPRGLPRGSFVQITDQREQTAGWTLQMKQSQSFMTSDGIKLEGAKLSFGHVWANSSGDGLQPNVTGETQMLETDIVYEIAKAPVGAGRGVWQIIFGASAENKYNQPQTIIPELDKKGKPIMNETTKQPIYKNQSIQLHLPEKGKILPGDYTTEITWILSELP